ncbi:MAG: SLBB domain-containing protein [Hydrotalea sp.]|nr:SLBB domain-containing protein [Hydrotalea sp.]
MFLQKTKLFSLLLMAVFCIQSMAQVGGMNIDQLTDQQIMQFIQANNLSGLSEAELESKARERGLSNDQIQKLKARMSTLNPQGAGSEKKSGEQISDQRKPVSYLLPKPRPDSINGLVIFGSDIFTKDNLTFEPNLNLPTPNQYVLGAGDQIKVDIFGYSDKTQSFTISPDGTIRYPNIGPIKLGGLNINEAKAKLQSQLAKIYPGLKGGNTSLQITLGQIRSIRVNLIGEITRPGTYTLSSVSTIANALYAAGGPTTIGSYRNIELIRAGKSIATFDLYSYLFNGDLTENKLLQDDDVIKVSPYVSRVEVRGAVKRNAIYELSNQESVSRVIEYAGGLSDEANRNFVKINRFGLKDRLALTIPQDKWSSTKLQTGDQLMIDEISMRFSNRVQIFGAVLTPGTYSLNTTNDLKSLLSISGLQEDAYMERAVVRRLRTDYQPEMIGVNLRDILSGQQAFPLQREDSVHIYFYRDLLPEYNISIEGEVNRPGVLPYAKKMHVWDAVLLAGGLKDGANKTRIEVARRNRDTSVGKIDKFTIVYSVDLDSNMEQTMSFALEPYDVVVVRRNAGYKEQMKVSIEGEVNFPGTYIISGNKERLSDLVKRAGGLREGAYPQGAFLLRKTFEGLTSNDSIILKNKIATLKSSFSDTLKAKQADSLLSGEMKLLGLNLLNVLSSPGSTEDIFLMEGDVIKIPQQLQTVQTFSGVYFPKKIVYRSGLNFRKVLRESGGALPLGQKRKSYVVNANGSISTTKNFLFFRNYPAITPGSEVYVPVRKQGKGISTAEIVGISGVLTSVVSMIFLIRTLQ